MVEGLLVDQAVLLLCTHTNEMSTHIGQRNTEESVQNSYL